MVTCAEFAEAAPELARTGSELCMQFGVGLAFLATVRRDGGPRLHPVCPVLSAERLFVLITPASPKREDLLRDGRYAPSSNSSVLSGRSMLGGCARRHVSAAADAAPVVPSGVSAAPRTVPAVFGWPARAGG